MKEKVELEDFFDFNKNEPIQRLAYSKEDVEYKLKIIKKMQELGMKIKIDKIGNICATLEANGATDKSILIGSHTDSVKDGGQYDGPAGVISGLKVIEQIVEKVDKKELKLNCNLKVIVWACEESNRFGKACLGSKWVEGTLDEKSFSMKEIVSKKEKDKCTLGEAVSEYLTDIKASSRDIEYVDKIISLEEIIKAYELHIEQYQYLSENDIDIGIISSISGPYRMKVKIDGKDKIKDAATLIVKLNEKARQAEKTDKYRATVPIIDIEQETIKNPDFLFSIDLLGEAAHSGSTPMTRRKDSIYVASKFILNINNKIKAEGYDDFKVYFEEIHTKNDSMNKVAGNSNIVLAVDANGLSQEIVSEVLLKIVQEVAQDEGVKINCRRTKRNPIKNAINKITKKEEKKDSNLKIDVRMQSGTNSKDVFNELSNMIIEIANETGNSYTCSKTDKSEPVKTSEELAKQISKVCEENNITYTTMPSWPGHDIAHISIMEKMLLFIKSIGGSHNPKESTTKENITKGITVLTGTVINDIEQVNYLANQVKQIEEYGIEEYISGKKSRKQGVVNILNELMKAKEIGITIPQSLRNNLKKEVIQEKDVSK